jgi:hypothetical protein
MGIVNNVKKNDQTQTIVKVQENVAKTEGSRRLEVTEFIQMDNLDIEFERKRIL